MQAIDREESNDGTHETKSAVLRRWRMGPEPGEGKCWSWPVCFAGTLQTHPAVPAGGGRPPALPTVGARGPLGPMQKLVTVSRSRSCAGVFLSCFEGVFPVTK